MHLLSVRGRSARRWWQALLLGSAAAVAATGVPALPALAGPAGTPPATLVVAKAVAPVVPLVTGGQVSVTAGGGSAAVLPSAARSSGGFVSYTSNGDHYLVPAPAAPYAGRQLSWSLFDVAALARDRIAGTARIPVSLSCRRGAARAAPPGVRLTSASGGSARGYVTASSGHEFAAWLRRRIGADIRAGRQPGSTPLPGGLATMSLAAPAPSRAKRVSPDYRLHIVQFNVTDLSGQPASFANVFIVNMDSVSRAFADNVPVDDGIGRVAVPAGHYVALAFFDDYDAQGNFIGGRWVTPSFTVPGTSSVTAVTLAEQSATSLVSVASTPRPATEYGETASFQPVDAHGQFIYGLGVQVYGPANPFGVPPAYLYVAPEPASPAGHLRFDVQWEGVPSSLSYRYDVAFASNDVPADEAYAVQPGSLATVYQHLSTDPASPGLGSFIAGMADPVTGEAPISFGDPQPEPTTMTEYLGTSAGGTWQLSAGNSLLYEEIYSADSQTFAARHIYSLDWAHGPIAPVFGQHAGPGFTCLACSVGSTLSLSYSSVGDSEPDHTAAAPFAGRFHFTMYRDGTQIVDAANALGVILTGVPAPAATYRVVFNSNLTGIPEHISQSTITHTDLTFRSPPHATPGAALPAGDSCYSSPTGAASSNCHILPVLTLNFQLAGDLTNTSSAPVQHMRLTVGHLAYDGHGSHAPITSATVAVSFDGGTTWQPAVVAGHDGHYIVTWKNPAAAAGTSPDLRVTATDAAGGSITQTITAAYTIAAR